MYPADIDGNGKLDVLVADRQLELATIKWWASPFPGIEHIVESSLGGSLQGPDSVTSADVD